MSKPQIQKANTCTRDQLRSCGEQLQYWYVDENGNEESPADDGDYEHDHYECSGCQRTFTEYVEALAHYAAQAKQAKESN